VGPDTAAPRPAPERLGVAFGRVLRGAGVDVPVGSVVAFVQALGAVGLGRRSGVYWAGRATLVRRPEDVPRYDAAFSAFWLAAPLTELAGAAEPPLSVTLAVDEELDSGTEGDPAPPGGDTITVRYSPTEVLRHKDFATYTAGELAEARRLMADLRLAGALRRSRRLRRSARGRGRPDLRTTVRHALRSGGEPRRLARMEASQRPRRVVLLVDISGSMEPYARALLRFVHAAVVGRARVEAFALGTRLTRLTRELASRDPDAALTAASRRVHDWSGGTRLGEGLRVFNDVWGVRGMARGAVVVIMSDGWDRGDPEVLAEQMRRLRRVAHRIVWVNPLKATPGFAPLARGMAAALPSVDELVEGHSLASLEALAAVIGT
jgi:uncharacterized protein with von Willebrand factor type A (vWA) domain